MKNEECRLPASFLDDDAFADLERAGNVKLSVACRAELNAAISYCIRLRNWHEAYSPKAVEARARIAKMGREFKAALNALDKPAYLSVVLGDDEGFVHFMEPTASSEDPQRILYRLDGIIERGDWKAPNGGDRRPGRPRDTHLVRLCEDAARIYERAGGRLAIDGDRSGAFADFISLLNDYVPPDYRGGSGDQLVKHAKKALNRIKTQRDRAAIARGKSPQ